ncbi:hypothetical protein SHKM778_79120 [Streptomyces sp. KM77-8]|uniref:Nucleoside diphosphate kinase n=1 Tax=Streptomyces haneummycinicus TaxID=3074435 RepID=A0AAT9HVX5_9ACTN
MSGTPAFPAGTGCRTGVRYPGLPRRHGDAPGSPSARRPAERAPRGRGVFEAVRVPAPSCHRVASVTFDFLACKEPHTMTQRTLVLLKPDAVRRALVGEILGRIERKAGWTITALELRTLDRPILEQHYAEHVGRPFYEPLVEFMASGPVVALIVEGERVIEGVRQLAGPTDPIAAAPGSIRGDFGVIVRENLIHASDSEESAEREVKIFFPGRA